MSKPGLNIDIKSVAGMIDELITTNIKCYMAQEMVVNARTDHITALYAKEAQMLNARRSQLIRAIDTRLGEDDITQTAKTYE